MKTILIAVFATCWAASTVFSVFRSLTRYRSIMAYALRIDLLFALALAAVYALITVAMLTIVGAALAQDSNPNDRWIPGPDRRAPRPQPNWEPQRPRPQPQPDWGRPERPWCAPTARARGLC